MDSLDAVWHLLNFIAPAVAVALLAASLAKLLWRGELAAVSWRSLVLWASLAGLLTLIAGLVLFGRDGKMATYAAMVVACAFMLWWRGWGPGRK